MTDERRVLSIAQDIIHCASNARVKVPKHVSLAMTVHHLTTSKILITLLNRMGHCSSYDEIQSVDTSLAMEVVAKSEEYGIVKSHQTYHPFHLFNLQLTTTILMRRR